MNNLNLLLDRPIAFNRAYVSITGDTNAGLFLSQFMYWSIRMNHDWFYKTRDEWIEETTLSRFQIERARKCLRGLNLISEERRGLPRKVYYKINLSTLNELLGLITPQLASNSPTSRSVSCQQVGEKLADKSVSFSPTNIHRLQQETTAKTTTENTNKDKVVDCVIPTAEEVLQKYHENLEELSKVKVLSIKRVRAIKTVLARYEKSRDISWWQKYFQKVKHTPFLMGDNPRKWKADFEFLINFDKLINIIEGKYDH